MTIADDDDDEGRPFEALSSSGLLWLINRVVFHPHGLALGLHTDENGTVTGWSLIHGEDGEPMWFPVEDDIAYFQRAQATLRFALDDDLPPLGEPTITEHSTVMTEEPPTPVARLRAVRDEP